MSQIAYFDASAGISGDMALGALLDLGVDIADVVSRLKKLTQLPATAFTFTPTRRQPGIDLEVLVAAEPQDRSWGEIHEMLVGSELPAGAKSRALDIFQVIAEAEAVVHGVAPEEVTFHERGALDSIIDIVGVAICLDLLGVAEVRCSAVRDGSGTIRYRYGTLRVPVPAVAEMARGSEIELLSDGDIDTELVTPTGFGILKGLGAYSTPEPALLSPRIGHGWGKRSQNTRGSLRIMLGDTVFPRWIELGIERLNTGDVSCVVIRDDAIVTTAAGKGISPLLQLRASQPQIFANAAVADTIIGKAAASVLIQGGVREVYGKVMSVAGRDFLQAHQIKAHWGSLVPLIQGTNGQGVCPIERAVLAVNDPQECLDTALATIQSLRTQP